MALTGRVSGWLGQPPADGLGEVELLLWRGVAKLGDEVA
jgi:hypothetical protein